MSKFLVARANTIVFLVLICVLLLMGGLTWDRFNAATSARLWVRHTYAVIGKIKDLNLAAREAETGQRGYLLTGDENYLAPYQAALGRITLLEGDLQQLTSDNPAQQQRLQDLAPIIARKLQELAQTTQMRRDGGFAAALRLVNTNLGLQLQNQIDAILGAMTSEEQRLLAVRMTASDRRANLLLWLIWSGTLLALAMLIWAASTLNQLLTQSRRAEGEHQTMALRLRTSLDSLSQGIAVFAASHELTNWNECFEILLGVPKSLARFGTAYGALYQHLAEGGDPMLESDDQIRHGRRSAGEPVVYEHTGAQGRHLELRRTSMPDGGFVLTISDMTKRVQAEAVLRESQKMQAIGQLTGGIAHDFNNLLTVILGNLEFVRDKPSDEHKVKLRLERAAWAAQRGAVLTRQLLAFARRQPLAPTALDLATSVPDLVPLLRRTLGEHIEVRYVETANLWPAMADPAQLESAVLNLALNARDAMPGGGRLTIELANKVLDDDYARRHAEVTAGDYTMLAVSDTGHGMTPEVVARAFEPFFTTKPDGKGSGLGLAMVFGFVKQSGGHVKIYSEPGEGTTVRIYLPRAVGKMPVISQRSSGPVDLPRGHATVLVVEDEPAVREIAVAILSELGYRVLEAADGEEGLRVFGSHAAEVDLLLSDVVLPGKVRGRELAERITAIRPEVSVLFMSGYTENSIVHNGRLDDGVSLISKPFQREYLARKVAEVLGARTKSNVVEMKPRRGE